LAGPVWLEGDLVLQLDEERFRETRDVVQIVNRVEPAQSLAEVQDALRLGDG